MDDIDLNLLPALDALLTENSVTAAAHRLGLSSSAMSRTLMRLRVATGDPLLVRAGRGLVPTPRAAELRALVHGLVRDVKEVLSPGTADLDVASMERTFTIRANEGFVDLFSGVLVQAVNTAAPGVRLRFAPKPLKDAAPLREGEVDLEIGTSGLAAPEVRTQLLFRDGFVGVARADHPLLEQAVTPERYASFKHVVASRRGNFTGPVDDALEALGLRRRVVAVVPGFPDALRVARQTALIALVPRSYLGQHSVRMGLFPQGLRGFALPVRTPEVAVAAMWHPRLDADPAQRWLRNTVAAACRAAAAPRPAVP